MPNSAPHARKPKSGYIPSLDGWRAIAILSVIWYHDPDLHGIGFLSTKRFHQVGWAGVNLFFAISGILICSRLLEEERLHGRISLKGFYVRRFFRIFPAAWTFLLVLGLLGATHLMPASAPALLASLFMVANFYIVATGDPRINVYSDHFWSLSVEEHFYLLLPSLLVFVRRRILVLGIFAAVSLAWFIGFASYKKTGPNLWTSTTDLQIHALLIPAFLAVLLSVESYREIAIRYLRPWACLAGLGIIFFGIHQLSVVQKTALAGICFPLVVASTILHPHSIATRLLELPPLRYIGRLSYGLYLWQQIFMIRLPGPHWPMTVLQTFPYNYIAAGLCTVTSYYLLEKPMLAIGHRLAPPATPGRQDLRENAAGQEQETQIPVPPLPPPVEVSKAV